MRLQVFKNSTDLYLVLTNRREKLSFYMAGESSIVVTSEEDKKIVLKVLEKRGIKFGLQGFNRKRKEVWDEVKNRFLWLSMQITTDGTTLEPEFHQELKKKGLVRIYKKEGN